MTRETNKWKLPAEEKLIGEDKSGAENRIYDTRDNYCKRRLLAEKKA
jgi:hypothetical protein